MKLNFAREIQQQRTSEDAKVEGIRREANEVFIYFSCFFFKLKLNFIS